MVDSLSKEKRSWNMSRVRGKDTRPEIVVRSLLHRSGFRFSLHRPDLPGKPDIVLPKYRTAIFVHGCFWHRHTGCADATTPKTHTDFWTNKFTGNIKRDCKNKKLLKKSGWRVLTVWECETLNPDKLSRKLKRFIETS
ncbi:MAG TPA: DNA mismatch endonuclease Vsr [bacterium]|nr:DNA mismatch endonuclease Vsr [bacterium]